MKRTRKKIKNAYVRSDGFAKDIVYSIQIDRIRANTAQPRKDFDVESIIKLADSIRRYGILQPLSVRRVREAKATAPAPKPSEKKINLVADVLSASLGEPATDEKSDMANENIASASMPMQLCIADPIPEIGSDILTQPSIDAAPERLAEVPFGVYKGATKCISDDTGRYELIAGERRLRAAKMLGLTSVPCIIVDVDDAISAELALVENMLRENLNMFELAAAFSHLSEKYCLTQEEIASKMSLSQSAVANKIRLLKLTPIERDLILENDLTERHARAFLRIQDAPSRLECIHHVIDRKLNVNETDKYITQALAQEKNVISDEKRTPEQALPTPDKLCSNIYKFITRMQSVSGNYLVVNRKSDNKSVVITLTVRKDS